MLRSGANMYHVKELLGHESLETLKHYAKLTITDLRKRRAPEPRPGIATFHFTFVVLLHLIGGFELIATPFPVGPRQCGQLSASKGHWSMATNRTELRHAAFIENSSRVLWLKSNINRAIRQLSRISSSILP